MCVRLVLRGEECPLQAGTSTVAEVVLPAGASDEQSREQETLLGTFSINTFRWGIMGSIQRPGTRLQLKAAGAFCFDCYIKFKPAKEWMFEQWLT